MGGIRESAQSWKELLLDLKRRGLAMAPQLAVADGALGFWKAIDEVWPKTRAKGWVHKTANVLNKLPKSLHAKAKRTLRDIRTAETRMDAIINTSEHCFQAIHFPSESTQYLRNYHCIVPARHELSFLLRVLE
jgi:transposase-like protein